MVRFWGARAREEPRPSLRGDVWQNVIKIERASGISGKSRKGKVRKKISK